MTHPKNTDQIDPAKVGQRKAYRMTGVVEGQPKPKKGNPYDMKGSKAVKKVHKGNPY